MRLLRLIILLSITASLSAQQTSGFKITYGTKNQRHGAVWNGGVDDPTRIRRTLGWHLHDDDRLRPPARWDVTMRSVGGDVASPGIILDLVGPETSPLKVRTRRRDLIIRPADIPFGKVVWPEGFAGDIAVERVPLPQVVSSAEFENSEPSLIRTRDGDYWLAWVAYKTRRRDGFFYEGADEIQISHSDDGRRWSRPQSITPPGDHFRVALGEDSDGRIVCVYGLQEDLGSGNFDLYAKVLVDGSWSQPRQLSDDPRPDVFHRLAGNAAGTLALVWMGWRDHPSGGLPQSDIFVRKFENGEWTDTQNLTQSPDDDWEPSVAVDSAGRAWVAWDTYANDGYDVMLQRADQPAPTPIAATPRAEMRAGVTVDADDTVWLSWEEGPANWGKDTGYENPRHRINLKKNGGRLYDSRAGATPRRPRIARLQTALCSNPPVRQSRPLLIFSTPNFSKTRGW